MPKRSILAEAEALTSGERRTAHGHPRDNCRRIAGLWSAFLGVPVTPRQAAICMVLVKVAREAHRPQRDSLIDIAGWSRVAELTGE